MRRTPGWPAGACRRTTIAIALLWLAWAAAAADEPFAKQIARLKDFSRNNPAQALLSGDALLTELQQQQRGRSPQAVQVLGLMCVAARNLGRAAEGQAYGERALRIAEAIGDRRGQADACNNLGVVAVDLNRSEQAIGYFSRSLQISRESGDAKGEAAARNNIGIVYDIRGEYEPARQQYLQALEIKRRLGDRPGMASTLGNIAIVCRLLGDYPSAVDYLLQALRLNEQTGNRRGIASALNNLGNLYFEWGDPRRALENYQRSLLLDQQLGNRAGEASDLSNIGLCHGKLGDSGKALEFLQRSLGIRQALGDRSAVATSLSHIGNAYAEQRRYGRALDFLRQALAVKRELGEKSEVAQVQLDLGRALRGRGDLAAAATEVNRALVASAAIGAVELQKSIYLEKSEIEAARGDYAAALASFRRHKEIQDRLFDESSRRRIAELQLRFEGEKKQQEIELLRRDRDIRRLQLKRQQLVKNASLGGVGLLLLLVALLLNRFRFKARAGREIQRKNDELSQAYAELDRIARTDPLTELSNRRDILERLQHEIARYERTARPLTLAIGDVDDFKLCNDRYGHSCGDLVLKAIADTIRALKRKQDLLSRWGGEEFFLVLPETDPAGARVLLDKIRAAIADLRIAGVPPPLQTTMTFGCAAFRPGDDVDSCLRRADQALFAGKRAGKNRVCVGD